MAQQDIPTSMRISPSSSALQFLRNNGRKIDLFDPASSMGGKEATEASDAVSASSNLSVVPRCLCIHEFSTILFSYIDYRILKDSIYIYRSSVSVEDRQNDCTPGICQRFGSCSVHYLNICPTFSKRFL